MTFLKVVMSIAIAVVLLVLLNNAMDKLFPTKSIQDRYDNNPYTQCQKSAPTYSEGKNADLSKSDEYQKCIDEASQKRNDADALDSINIWTRSLVVLLILVISAIFLFKRYPFYSSALIGTGILFMITYPIFARYGGTGFLGGYEGDISASVKNKVELFKILVGLIAFVGLSIADLLFFEKHKSGTPTSTD